MPYWKGTTGGLASKPALQRSCHPRRHASGARSNHVEKKKRGVGFLVHAWVPCFLKTTVHISDMHATGEVDSIFQCPAMRVSMAQSMCVVSGVRYCQVTVAHNWFAWGWAIVLKWLSSVSSCIGCTISGNDNDKAAGHVHFLERFAYLLLKAYIVWLYVTLRCFGMRFVVAYMVLHCQERY